VSLKLNRKQSGFTLLELLIVIVIIGILALIIVPGLASGPKRARDAQRKSDLRAVKNALETYFNDNNSYPSASTTAVTPATDATISGALVPNYMKVIPDDPKGGSAHYNYTCTTVTSGTCTAFKLDADLENTSDHGAGVLPNSNTYEVTSVN
jgi:general secretion pathway protein G